MGFQTDSRWLTAGAVVAALIALLAWNHERHPQILRTGDRLQSLRVFSLNGTSSEARTSGRAQLINIFATWCPPCRQEAPAIAQLALDMKSRDVDVVGVDQEEPAAAVEQFARSFHLPYPLYIDRTNVTHDRLGARIIPTTIFVDAQGIIRWQRSGPLTRADLRSLAGVVAVVQ